MTTINAAIYARYSSDLQSDASIVDQVRQCTERAQAEGWTITQSYSDAGISGASLLRPGIQNVIQDAMDGKFNILLCEALDRLSRDQEDIAGLYKRMEFANVKIITLSEGEISSLHIGLKGTMNAMFLKDLADKTKRGLRGRVEKGKSGGGLPYGYKAVKQFNSEGEVIRGDREIDEYQADIIRRIFREYAFENKSPKAIANGLNIDNIPCPSGSSWGQSTINGNRKRGTGILNNHLYIGELVWNRQRFIKNPNTGKRVSRFNPESAWVKTAVPELRIIPQDLWDAVKARQSTLERKQPEGLWQSNRPQYLLSGLTKCGQCGGGYAKMNATHYGCSTSKNKGLSVCSNRKTIKREILENLVLNGLRTHLMRSEIVEVFCQEYANTLKQISTDQNKQLKPLKAELNKLNREQENIVQAIKDGIPADLVKNDLQRILARREEVEKLIKTSSTKTAPLIHPAIASRYQEKISTLIGALDGQQNREAHNIIRDLIKKVVLTPQEGKYGLRVDLHGDLAKIFEIASDSQMNMESLNWVNLLTADGDNQGYQQDSVGSGGRI